MFRVTARTVLQLGAELISSDAVAFYELIKNTYDAQSPRVDVDVVVRLPYAKHLACWKSLQQAQAAEDGDEGGAADAPQQQEAIGNG